MRRRCALLVVLMLALYGLGAQQVDLTTIDAYVRPGFSLEWVFQTPALGDESWTLVPANPGNRPLVMRNLDLPGSSTRSLFSFAREKPQRYSVMLPFVVKEEILISRTGVGLYLAQIGQNWQIYLNGYLVRDETYTTGDGTMRIERAVRGALVELDTRYLKKGKNLLTIVIMGNPGDDRTGLYMGGPYLVDSYEALESMRKEGLKLILIGIYFFFGLYHAILFILRPKAKAYLYYGLATGLLSIYLFCRTFIVYELILDTRIIKGMELSSLFLLLPAFMAFFDSVRARPVSLFAKIYGGVFALVAVLRFFFWSEAFLRLWQYSVVLPILYIFIVDIGIPIVSAVKAYRGSGYTRFWRRLLGGLKSNDAAKLLVGTLLVGSAVGYDIVGLNAGRAAMYSDYAYLLLVFGTAATLAGQIVRAYSDSESLGADLARRVEARTKELEATLEDQDELSVSLSETSTSLQTKVETAAKDMRVATRVQQGFFPAAAPQTEAWDCAFSFIPASGISGDFYDFFMRGDRLDGLVVGDVSGHGIASGLITVLARSIFHRNFYELKKRSLGSVLESINEELIPELSSVDNFITTALLRLDPKGGVEYSSAAHTEILYRGADKTRAVPLKPSDKRDYKGPPLGREGLEAPYTSIRFSLRPGDVILIYTDGFDEAKNVEGMPFGIDGMLGALTSAPEGDAAQMLDFMVREWRFHVSGTKISDDATAILLKKRELST